MTLVAREDHVMGTALISTLVKLLMNSSEYPVCQELHRESLLVVSKLQEIKELEILLFA